MNRTLIVVALVAIILALNPLHLQAQPQGPWIWNIDGGALHQSETDFKDADGAFSADRWFVTGGATYAWSRRDSIGLAIGGGRSIYHFDDETTWQGGEPWSKVSDFRISAPLRMGFGERGSWFVMPTLRFNGESGADSGDSSTWGLFGAVAWRLSPNLTIGPGIGVFSRLEKSTRVFPILVIDWNITERLNLSTGRGLAASLGPGLTLSYEINNHWSVGLTGRYEDSEFRLDDEGPNPGGIGRDQAMPIVLSGVLKPNESASLSLFMGLEFGGELSIKDEFGDTLEKTEYDLAPLIGATFEVRF